MEQNAQNTAFYPHAFHPSFNLSQHAFAQEDFLPPSYPAPSAPSSATQGFHTIESVQAVDYGRPREERTVASSDSPTKTNADNFFQALEAVSNRLSQLENIVQGLECSIEGLKRAEREKHNENNDKLARLELLIKEVLTGVQHLNESQNLDGAMSQMRKLQVVDEKAPAGEEMQISSMERWQHPSESHSYVELSDPSEQMTQHVSGRPSPPHYSEAPSPPQSQNYAASHNMLPPPPSMNEPGKPIQHPFPPPPHPHPSGPPTSGQPLHPHHSMQVPPFSYQAQAHASLPMLPPPPPPPPGLPNSSMETNSYGHMQSHQQYTEPPRPLSNSYPELPQYYGGAARQEMPHSSPQYGSSGTHVYEPTAGMVGATPVYMQSQPQSSPLVSTYETTNGARYNSAPPYRAAQPVPSATSGGGGIHSRLSKAQSMPVGSASTNHHQISEVTEKVIAMGFTREQVRAVVQGLTDIGQPVDMNTVLDKLMNRGESTQSQRGRYGRG